MEKDCPVFSVRKINLIGLAGLVWMIAGYNVIRMGVLAYGENVSISLIKILLSLVVFIAFGWMFYSMTNKHVLRIDSYSNEKKAVWRFFDLKSYIIMAFMMTFGILLRKYNIVSKEFIAVFYTGLGAALFASGLLFIKIFLQRKLTSSK